MSTQLGCVNPAANPTGRVRTKTSNNVGRKVPLRVSVWTRLYYSGPCRTGVECQGSDVTIPATCLVAVGAGGANGEPG
jgi:hypothetical protein